MKKQVYLISTLLTATTNMHIHSSLEPKQRSQKPLPYVTLVPDIDKCEKTPPSKHKKNKKLSRQLSNNGEYRHTPSPTNTENPVDTKIIAGLQELLLTTPTQQPQTTVLTTTSEELLTAKLEPIETQQTIVAKEQEQSDAPQQQTTANTIRALLEQQPTTETVQPTVSWTEWLTFGWLK